MTAAGDLRRQVARHGPAARKPTHWGPGSAVTRAALNRGFTELASVPLVARPFRAENGGAAVGRAAGIIGAATLVVLILLAAAIPLFIHRKPNPPADRWLLTDCGDDVKQRR